MIQSSVSSVALPAPVPQTLTASANLQARMLAAQTIGELHALYLDYTDVEMNLVYSQLTPEQQHQINVICSRDSKV